MTTLYAADLFCGAGGTSTGLLSAAKELGLQLDLLAVNHWDTAIATHQVNHPQMRHLCESLDAIDPRKMIPGRLDILVASPECTHHSRARGGRPVSDQLRSSAWHVVRWTEALRPRWVLIENVREFRTWGPLGANGKPLKSRRGETFDAFVQALESLNYTVEHRILNAADYGDPTSRERLFVLARRGRRRIHWPQATHGQSPTLFSGSPWRTARDIIDWQLPSQSIFTRKRPLAPATLARIEAGLRKFGGAAAEPFLVILRNNMTSRSVDRPLPTVTTSGAHFALCEPFLLPHRAFKKGHVDSVDAPLRPFTATNGGGALVEPFIVPQMSSGAPRSPDLPLPTITTTSRGIGLVEPFLVSYYGTGGPQPLARPLNTVTTKPRFGLVEPARLDIHFRMLQPHELAAAMGFPQDYQFTGNKSEQVKQIGNAVPVNLAAALGSTMLKDAA